MNLLGFGLLPMQAKILEIVSFSFGRVLLRLTRKNAGISPEDEVVSELRFDKLELVSMDRK
jgi:hypothetical protein